MADFILPPKWQERSNWNAAVLLTLTASRMFAMELDLDLAGAIARSARVIAELDKPIAAGRPPPGGRAWRSCVEWTDLRGDADREWLGGEVASPECRGVRRERAGQSRRSAPRLTTSDA